MGEYADLRARIDEREVIILDGAIGTQLQRMEVPLSHDAWAAIALQTHPFTVRRLHELYIEAGVDVITTNTYSSARHNLLPLGLGDKVHELNLRAVMLAQDARDRAAKARRVWIGGSVSSYGLMAGAEPGWKDYQYLRDRVETSENQARANLREQAEILAESGVDFLIAEPTGTTTQRRWVFEACLATGLPVWSGFKCRRDAADGSLEVGYASDEAFDAELASLAPPRRRARHRVPLAGGRHRRRALGGRGPLERPDRHLSRVRTAGLRADAPRRFHRDEADPGRVRGPGAALGLGGRAGSGRMLLAVRDGNPAAAMNSRPIVTGRAGPRRAQA